MQLCLLKLLVLQLHNQQDRILHIAKQQNNEKKKKKIKEMNSNTNRCELVACVSHAYNVMALYASDYYRHVLNFHCDHKCFMGPGSRHSSTPHNEQ